MGWGRALVATAADKVAATVAVTAALVACGGRVADLHHGEDVGPSPATPAEVPEASADAGAIPDAAPPRGPVTVNFWPDPRMGIERVAYFYEPDGATVAVVGVPAGKASVSHDLARGGSVTAVTTQRARVELATFLGVAPNDVLVANRRTDEDGVPFSVAFTPPQDPPAFVDYRVDMGCEDAINFTPASAFAGAMPVRCKDNLGTYHHVFLALSSGILSLYADEALVANGGGTWRGALTEGDWKPRAAKARSIRLLGGPPSNGGYHTEIAFGRNGLFYGIQRAGGISSIAEVPFGSFLPDFGATSEVWHVEVSDLRAMSGRVGHTAIGTGDIEVRLGWPLGVEPVVAGTAEVPMVNVPDAEMLAAASASVVVDLSAARIGDGGLLDLRWTIASAVDALGFVSPPPLPPAIARPTTTWSARRFFATDMPHPNVRRNPFASVGLRNLDPEIMLPPPFHAHYMSWEP